MVKSIRIRNQSFSFHRLYEIMAKANELKSGDQLAGIAAETELERMAAKTLLAETTLQEIFEKPAVPYEQDEVTQIIYDNLDMAVFNTIKDWTVAQLRDEILKEPNYSAELSTLGRGLTSEMTAAVTKLMSNLDLMYAAKKIHVTATCRTTLGSPGVLASRLQPNHPTDSIDGILASTFEGLSYGSGDALIGVNPADDRPPTIKRIMNAIYELAHEQLHVPTQTCVLAHITTQIQCLQSDAKADVLFQSIAGTKKGNESFGINKKMLDEGYDFIMHYEHSCGPNRMYFETGQGSELSAEAHEGIDQLTLEARCYGLARHYTPFMVNSVVGFIGPEYLYDAKQITRAAFEDHFMGKLMGLPMGLDVCYTNHAQTDQNDLENLAALLTSAGVNFFMGVPMGDDVMLNYQTTSFHDIATLREIFNLQPVPEFKQWLETNGYYENGMPSQNLGNAALLLK